MKRIIKIVFTLVVFGLSVMSLTSYRAPQMDAAHSCCAVMAQGQDAPPPGSEPEGNPQHDPDKSACATQAKDGK